ncbi:MAG: carbonic anhydrase family protein [Deltaproteobacteria bacterium]|nr:carbonic anhydrase family protein [Deltaproteobacteria bacterium]
MGVDPGAKFGLALGFGLLLGFGQSGCRTHGSDPLPGPAASTVSSRPVEWGYYGDASPERWAALSPAYAACAHAGTQSPIELADRAASRGVEELRMDYRRSGLRIAHHQHVADILDDGHTIQVTVDEGSRLSTRGESYALKQFHFHTPAEHALAGRRFPMEIHFVHQSARGRFAVLAAFVDVGESNPGLAQLIEHVPGERGESVHRPDVTVDPGVHFASMTGVLAYQGSFTTPPCTENVEWLVMSTPLTASRDQIAAFADRLEGNARPLQPRGDRAIERRPFSPKLSD